MTRDYSAEIHEKVMQIYKDFDALLKVVGDCRKDLKANQHIIRVIEDLDEEQWQEFRKAFAFLMTADEAKELTKAAEERERKAKLLETFDKIQDRKSEEVAHHAV